MPEARLAVLREALAEATAAQGPFEIALAGLGTFPPGGRPRVLFLSIVQGADRVEALAASVERGLAPLGFPDSGRGFHAHLTLGRVKRVPHGAAAAGLDPADCGPARLRGITLFRSELSSGGARHSPLARFALTRLPESC